MQHHHQEQFELQSKDLHIVQESLMEMICDVDDIRRRLEKFTLSER
jgi:hypothetical protein